LERYLRGKDTRHKLSVPKLRQHIHHTATRYNRVQPQPNNDRRR